MLHFIILQYNAMFWPNSETKAQSCFTFNTSRSKPFFLHMQYYVPSERRQEGLIMRVEGTASSAAKVHVRLRQEWR